MTSAVAPNLWGTQTYAYDALNNLRTLVSGGVTSNYNYDPTNRLSTITKGGSTASTFSYDSFGNMISKNGVSLIFDQKNQLTQVTGYDSYAYDASGRRTTKTPANGSPAVYYFYNHSGQSMYQLDTSAVTAINFIYLGSKLIARHDIVLPPNPPNLSYPSSSSSGNYTVNWN
jgi:YD repeat-containing protein